MAARLEQDAKQDTEARPARGGKTVQGIDEEIERASIAAV
jgi:hypothetical protein